MSVRAWVQGCALLPVGSELVADVAANVTTLTVDDTTDYDDDGGTVSVNGQVVEFVGVDEDAGTISLVSPLAAAATVGDRVFVMGGGQVLYRHTLVASCGDGDPAEPVVPFEQRAMWPEGDYDEAVQVLLSDDLERIVSVPGATPRIDSSYIDTPYASATLQANVSVPDAAPLVVTTWQVVDMTAMTYEPAGGIFRLRQDGMYRATFGATYEANGTGNRRLVPRKHYADGTNEAARDVRVTAAVGAPTAFEVTLPDQRLYAGEGLSFETSQSSGAALALLGSSAVRSRPTEVSIIRVAP